VWSDLSSWRSSGSRNVAANRSSGIELLPV
jgi:hypothetical protein